MLPNKLFFTETSDIKISHIQMVVKITEAVVLRLHISKLAVKYNHPKTHYYWSLHAVNKLF